MIIGNREFKDYTFVMAIINVTPDSFWHGSRHDADDVLFAVEKAVKEGAAVRYRRAVHASRLYRSFGGAGDKPLRPPAYADKGKV